jgi:hypothetical protein
MKLTRNKFIHNKSIDYDNNKLLFSNELL